MKKILLVLLILILSVMITACRDNPIDTTTADDTTESVETTTESTVESEPVDNMFNASNEERYSIYYIEENLVESNCKACKVLPSNHNFSTLIWDVSDTSHPVLK